MPHGFIITEWTEDQGLAIKLSYPEDLQIDLDDMMRIFYAKIYIYNINMFINNKLYILITCLLTTILRELALLPFYRKKKN